MTLVPNCTPSALDNIVPGCWLVFLTDPSNRPVETDKPYQVVSSQLPFLLVVPPGSSKSIFLNCSGMKVSVLSSEFVEAAKAHMEKAHETAGPGQPNLQRLSGATPNSQRLFSV